ncbi:MAG: class I SAM-dependent methyltransferase [Alphaproteobacteria bacterium]|nr:class I SAM-dependent methyltransferase [Alphaproteobacteria bacterium]
MPNSNTQLSKNRIQAFSDLYHKKLLGDYETTSGNGSTLVNSSRMRRGLSEFISWGVGSVLDVGCGDFNWQRALQLNGCQILAVDVVPELIEKNKKIYTQPNIRFDVMDIVTTIPPAHDLVICRDLFTHFPSSDIVAAVNNIK